MTDASNPDEDNHFTALPPAHYKTITPSYLHTCGLRTDEQVVCYKTVYDIERADIVDIASVDREFLSIDGDGRVYCMDAQEEGNCATGEPGFIQYPVEVVLPAAGVD